jgi:DNA polymerase-3 subunit epsilon
MLYTIIDVETTGGNPKSSKITEIAIFKHNGAAIIDKFVSLVNPESEIPEFISRLTGITNEMVANAPKFYEIANKIIEFTAGCVFVAHNASFDYSMIRSEFRSLGFDFRRSHLCTVKASRHLLPGFDSYSLGKLVRNFGITISERHRAEGDAFATSELFTILFEKNSESIKALVHHEINVKTLHPDLDITTLDEIPNKTGIYHFFNEFNQLIYVGKSNHIKQKIEQHLRNSKTKKDIQLSKEIVRIEHLVTGTELIAQLLESQVINDNQPAYNTKIQFPYGIFNYTDTGGYVRFFVEKNSKNNLISLVSFQTKKEANSLLENACQTYNLCHKLCGLVDHNNSCILYISKQCNNSCILKEPIELYNSKVEHFMQSLNFCNERFYIVDKGRHKGEKSLICIEYGNLIGYGFAPYHFQRQEPEKWKKYLTFIQGDYALMAIVRSFLYQQNKVEIIQY